MENLKRKRNNTSHKRWTDEEVKMILEYLQEHQDIEKPTAQIFYRKLADTMGINASWDLIRWKVRNLKTNYLKAETWRKSTEAGLLDNELSIQVKLRNMCRFYDELRNIFGQKNTDFPFEMLDSGVINNMGVVCTPLIETSSGEEVNFCGFDDCSTIDLVETENSTPSAISVSSSPTSSPADIKKKSVEEFAAKLKRASPKNSLDQLSALQRERNDIFKIKIEFEKEKFKQEFELKLRQFEENVKERKEQFKLKKLELEKEERLRTLELELKYKYAAQKE